MMTEREDIASKRNACHNAVSALREALSALELLPSNLVASVNPLGSRTGVTPVPGYSRSSSATPEGRTTSSAPSSPIRGFGGSARRSGSSRDNPRAVSQAARMAVAAMAASALKDDSDLTRRAESVANPFCWDKSL